MARGASPTGAVPRVAILVPSWNGRAHLETCLAALAGQHDPGVPWQTWVLDNGSTDGTAEWLRRAHPSVRLLESPTNLGFAAGVNRLVEAAADAELVAFLNNDTRPEPDWLGELVAALTAAPAEVSAVSGCILDWEGERLDFGRGVVTFDGHAFQLDYRRPLSTARRPRPGDELPFACGGNLLVRRERFLAAGGFDPAYFAYYEDVDLGWRLWSRGERILAAPRAVVRHRSGATSDLLGLYRRGFLFERNAFLTVHKNLDEELWPRLMPVVMLTLMARSQHLLARCNPGGELLGVDPYAATAAVAPAPAPDGGRFGNLRRGDLAGAWRSLRNRLRRPHGGDGARLPLLSDERTVTQLQAISSLLGGLDGAAERRRQVQVARRVPDRELFARFPLWVVPTYPGDEALFASPGFRSWLPHDLPLVEARLADVMEWP
ncbi:MAG TPA: glycosyltransferase family 2 protein [Thermoanaerobaculia bacterium]|jgi:GT2 family glycosyltransferase|nr:glycosyltransferase family 2 protein [Thermoanaerobaculia bacterium]